jgi:hypothetical protein
MYKFIGDGTLIEHMYLFISILVHYQIQPIFVFDGKPPPEKRDLIVRRSMKKKKAELQFKKLEESISTLSPEEKPEVIAEMDVLKKQFIRVRDQDIHKAKQIMDAYGVHYIDAPGEADLLCVHLVQRGTAYACISDDMDMFIYGCPRVIRNISLMNHTGKSYDTSSILEELALSERHFREIVVLSGTDYNSNTNATLKQTLNWFADYQEYRKTTADTGGVVLEFYVWLLRHSQYIEDYEALLRTYQFFQLQYKPELEKWNDFVLTPKHRNCVRLHDIMSEDGFIFM